MAVFAQNTNNVRIYIFHQNDVLEASVIQAELTFYFQQT